MAKAPDYAARWAAVRGFLSVNLNPRKRGGLTPAQKGTLTRYFHEIRKLTHNQSVYEYAPRSIRRLRSAQQFAQHPSGLPKLKVAFIPVPGRFVDGEWMPEKPDLVFDKKGRLREMHTKGARRITYNFADYEIRDGEFQLNPEKVVKRILQKDKKKSGQFKIQCGRHLSSMSFASGESLAETVGEWKDRYADSGEWLTGVVGYKFTRQRDAESYYKALKKAGKKPKRKGNK